MAVTADIIKGEGLRHLFKCRGKISLNAGRKLVLIVKVLGESLEAGEKVGSVAAFITAKAVLSAISF